ncbi:MULTISPECIES: ScbA/BarX family gamma-butyrolactone biosynthesis protein [unclassified Streptomyces]|uniref:ScbA/BarX family gamma-butyrolactone biosynthesis protein n=1 Tax=unclassified Streptomyces TaxID=2593676 RepID=UPI00037E2798|nr:MULTISPECIES: ScbA/BarX family gamma-butyrolactone biosynthesis protein [unclassified Streptomyces]MYX28443.1 gamma-butyrolactone biosynthesis protein [Streptomyces sp. SID8381]
MSASTLRSTPSPVEQNRTALTFDRTVPRQLVHRASVAEVFLTDGTRIAADRFLVGAQWPRRHVLYRPDRSGRHDFMLLAETVRQAGIFLIHRFHDVPLGHHFVFRSLDLRIDDLDSLRVGATPLGAVLDITVTASGDTARRLDARLDVTVEVDGRPCAYGSVSVVVLDARGYDIVRRRGRDLTAAPPADTAAPSTAPAVAGRQDADVLLRSVDGAGPDTWLLHVDPRHPGYFEHPSDHVPGMVLLEAFRQAGHLAAARDCVLASLEARFRAFGELCRPIVIRSAARPDGPLHLTAHQGERTLAEADALFVRA